MVGRGYPASGLLCLGGVPVVVLTIRWVWRLDPSCCRRSRWGLRVKSTRRLTRDVGVGSLRARAHVMRAFFVAEGWSLSVYEAGRLCTGGCCCVGLRVSQSRLRVMSIWRSSRYGWLCLAVKVLDCLSRCSTTTLDRFGKSTMGPREIDKRLRPSATKRADWIIRRIVILLTLRLSIHPGKNAIVWPGHSRCLRIDGGGGLVGFCLRRCCKACHAVRIGLCKDNRPRLTKRDKCTGGGLTR